MYCTRYKKKSPGSVLRENCSNKFCKIHRKIPAIKIFPSKVAGLVQWFSQTKTNNHTRATFQSVNNHPADIYKEVLNKIIFRISKMSTMLNKILFTN